jgi:hypothetical protein
MKVDTDITNPIVASLIEREVTLVTMNVEIFKTRFTVFIFDDMLKMSLSEIKDQ